MLKQAEYHPVAKSEMREAASWNSNMITGSVVSSLQGEPRSTHDIDMVVAIRSFGEFMKLKLQVSSPDEFRVV